ncbi:CRISPR-associated protein, Csm4 family [Betaproteobacteria bacterium]|nr:CRISPR-associated protein, Csm4 family [Betaproteobacteria bacterium]GHU00515.1 CRISPR-associated protein, Csm4 family [Betaproteobacteria bacterium]GHU20589.1 CRISPR-associated protein, Csm4 family [Betaproteobacteria bacterium]
MQTHRFTLHPQTAFGTPLVGDTLFGQLCWGFVRRFGNDWLTDRLQGYTKGNPFLVLSDAFPQGFLPLPTVPGKFWDESKEDRKKLKKKRWLPVEEMESPFSVWQSCAYNDAEAAERVLKQNHADMKIAQEWLKRESIPLQTLRTQPHNTINRATSTTGEDMFAPYTQTQIWFHPEMRLELYAVLDETRVTAEELVAVLTDMGQSGYGRDASIGLGKFEIKRDETFSTLPHSKDANAWLTLAPAAPQGLGFDANNSFYQPLTRFGRHGDAAVHSGNPFKRPLLLAKTGSVFTPINSFEKREFQGQGLGDLSSARPETVAQGYAPVVGIRMEIPR